MDTDYEGELWLDGTLATGKDPSYLSQLRNEKIGFVFQFHYLLNEFTVLENVMIPALKLARLSRAEIEQRAME
jgi:lipoprotein-releasing system ATP-binding protein